MRLYHFHFIPKNLFILIILLTTCLAGCTSPEATQTLINVQLHADGETIEIQIPAGSTVQKALEAADIELDTLDRTSPAIFTVLGEAAEVRVIRVREEYEIEEVVIPYEYQMVRNESLPVEKEMLIQKGENGLQEITYRRVYENGIEVSSEPIAVKSIIVKEPVPEIRMVGVQAPFAPVSITGQLLYIRDGNVWAIEEATNKRRPVLTTGDLDGRIFSISSDGTWMLFTRLAKVEGRINELWAANIAELNGETIEEAIEERKLIDLEVNNVIHFADWVPGSNTKVVFSTVEPRNSPPGWQANNDLYSLTFSTSGWTTQWQEIIEPNFGGIYGWWGTEFSWSPDGKYLSFARPDGVGVVNYNQGVMTTTLEILPLQPQGDWAWVPGTTWGPDGNTLYTVDHIFQNGAPSPEESQLFDVTAVPLVNAPPIHLVSPSGMFAYPLTSPIQQNEAGEFDYQIAYLQAIFPQQSLTSRYHLAVMDRDGSNRRDIFPNEATTGMEPQQHWGAWSPDVMPDSGNYAIALLHQGNLWLVNVVDGKAVQVTGDGLTKRVLWRQQQISP